MVDKSVVEVLTSQVSVTSGSLHFEDTLLNGQERNIKGSSPEIEDEDVALAGDLLVKTVGDGSSGGLVDDTKDVQSGDGSGVLGGLTLRVVEVGGDGDDGVGNGSTEVRLSGLLHLEQDHGRDFLGRLIKMTSDQIVHRNPKMILTKSLVSPRYSTWMEGLPALSTILKGKCFMSAWTSLSANLRPMRRLASKTLGYKDTKVRSGLIKSLCAVATYVLWGFMATWFLAASPMRRSLSEKDT